MAWWIDKTGTWQQVYDAKINKGSSWHQVQQMWVNKSGTWRQFYQYVPQINTSLTASANNSSPAAPSTTITVSGVVSAASGSVPVGSTVQLKEGSTVLASALTVSGGAYSISWAPTQARSYSLTAYYVLNGVYQPSSSSLTVTPTATSTTNVTSALSYVESGNNFTISGTVTTATGQTPTGTVTLYRDVAGVRTSLASGSLSSGAYSLVGNTAVLGACNFVVVYAGTSYFLTDEYLWASTVSRPPVGATTLTGDTSGMTSTSCNMDWTAAANATSYEVHCVETGYSHNVGNVLTYTWSVAKDNSYTFYVKALNEHPVSGSYTSNSIVYASGHPEVRKTGSCSNLSFNALSTGNYRPDVGWGWLSGGALAQGYYSSSGSRYTGIIKFDKTAIRNYFDSAFGDGVWDNFSCTNIDIYLDRDGSSGDGTDSIGWYLSTTTPGSGTPALYGNQSMGSGLSLGSAGWVNIPADNYGTEMVKNSTYSSLAIYRYDTTDAGVGYAGYSVYAGGGTYVKMRVSGSWNFVTTSYKAPTWS